MWDEYDEDIEKFKLKYIVPHIVSIEQSEKRYPLCENKYPCSSSDCLSNAY